jgi:hypothetical protein
MIIFVGLGFVGFGFLMFKFYRGYRFHHSIGIPIIVLGFIIFIGGIGYKITEKRTKNILDISSQEIQKLKIDYIYDPYDSLKEISNEIIDNPKKLNSFLKILKNGGRCDYVRFSTEWYIDLIFELKTNKRLYFRITKTTNGIMFDQTIKYGFIPVGTEKYYCIENIIPLIDDNFE